MPSLADVHKLTKLHEVCFICTRPYIGSHFHLENPPPKKGYVEEVSEALTRMGLHYLLKCCINGMASAQSESCLFSPWYPFFLSSVPYGTGIKLNNRVAAERASPVPQHSRKATAQTQRSEHKTTAGDEQVWGVGPKGGCPGPLRPNSPLGVHLQSNPPLLPSRTCRLLCGTTNLAEGPLKIPSKTPLPRVEATSVGCSGLWLDFEHLQWCRFHTLFQHSITPIVKMIFFV